MALYVRDTGGGADYGPAPAGFHLARCYRVLDMGLQPGAYGDKATVLLQWELNVPLPDGDGNFTVGQRYTPSLGAKSKLRAHLESWRGRPFSDEELAAFDLFKVAGVFCQLSVVHKPATDGTGTVYANISAIVPAGGKTFPASEEVLVYTADDPSTVTNFQKLGEGLQARIRDGEARRRALHAQHLPQQPQQPMQQPTPPPQQSAPPPQPAPQPAPGPAAADVPF